MNKSDTVFLVGLACLIAVFGFMVVVISVSFAPYVQSQNVMDLNKDHLDKGPLVFDDGVTMEGGSYKSATPYIITDNKTGVEYIVISEWNDRRLFPKVITPRLDQEGKPMVSEAWLSAREAANDA
ncbi:MAG: DUF6440 family protein [Methanocorpusculum sp.]|nr:DUF6440 family protein [Methanocorpusculum sp.]MDE2524602.1 DUF6440 family protein [Methanocorpusculum sp.]